MKNYRPQPVPRLTLLAGLALSAAASTASAQTIQLKTIAETTQVADGISPSATFAGITSAFLNPSTKAIVNATVTGGPVTAASNTGVWSGEPNLLTLVAREGQAAPGTGSIYSDSPFAIGLNTAGEGAVRSAINTPAGSGIFANFGGAPAAIAATGLAAPGTAGTNYSVVGAAAPGTSSTNDVGDIAFNVTLGPAATTANDKAIYFHTGGVTSLIAREGSQVTGFPGTPPNFSDAIGGFMVTTNLGYVVIYSAYVGGTPAFSGAGAGGLILRDPMTGNFSQMVQRNALATGAGAGVRFGGISGVAVNDSNAAIFAAPLSGGGVTAANDSGVWMWDPTTPAAVTKIAQEGDSAPGTGAGVVFSTFDELYLSNNGVRAFSGVLTGGGVTAADDRIIYADFGSGLQLVAREGVTPLVGGTGGASGVITAIENVSMNLDGEILLQASVQTGGGPLRGVWKRGSLAGDSFVSVLTVGEAVFDMGNTPRTVSAVRFSKRTNTFSVSQGNQPVGRQRPINENDEVSLLATHSGVSGGGAYIPLPVTNQLTAIAVGGMETHGLPNGRYDTVRPGSVINDNGLVAFRAYTKKGVGPVGANDFQGMWAQASGGAVTLTARNGVAQPSGAPVGSMYEVLDLNPAWNNNNILAYPAKLLNGAGGVTQFDRWGIWTGAPGAVSLYSRAGSTVVDGMPANSWLYYFTSPVVSMNDSESMVIRSVFRTGAAYGGVTLNNDSAVMRYVGPDSWIIAREDDTTPDGAKYADFALQSYGFLWHNVYCETVFKGQEKVTNNHAIWWQDSFDDIFTYARTGDPVPNQIDVNYLVPEYPLLTDSFLGFDPIIAFRTTLQGTAVTAGLNDQALLLGDTYSDPILFARTGIANDIGAPPSIGDVAYKTLGAMHASPDGNLTYRATLMTDAETGLPGGVTTANDVVVYAFANGILAQVAREGDFAPDSSGAPSAVTFADFGTAGGIGLPTIGADGRLGFVATLAGPGVVASNDTGFFVLDSLGTMRLVVREGDIISVPNADTVTRNVTVARIVFGSWDASRPDQQRQFGGDKVVLNLEFTDLTSGVFTAEAL